MSPLQRPTTALRRLVEKDEQLLVQFPALASPIYTAVSTGQSFDRSKADLVHALSDTLRMHTEYDEATKATADDATVRSILTQAMAAQHRALSARLDELEQATIGLDVVAIARTVYAMLNLALDLERRTLQTL